MGTTIVNLTSNRRKFLKITSSISYMFSPNVSQVNVTVVGKGGAGSNGCFCGGGGGAGLVSIRILLKNE